MSAPRKATDGEIRAAWKTWGGSVDATAAALRISRQSLYPHLRRLGLLPQKGTTLSIESKASQASVIVRGSSGGVGSNSRVNFPAAGEGPSFSGVSSVTVDNVQMAPGKKSPPVYLTPQMSELVAKIRRRLSHHMDQDLTDSTVVGMLIEDEMEDWATRMVARLTSVPLPAPKDEEGK
jgi:hypothetical protein